MATRFEKADERVSEMAQELIEKYHSELKSEGVKVDLVMAYAEVDEITLEPLAPALKHHGMRALGIARKINLKDRAMGRGDAEISIDGGWWEAASDEERKALLDHELTHLVATPKRDDLQRPILKMRPHDVEFGWFASVAQRHGGNSQERQQAKSMMDKYGQYFWCLTEDSQNNSGSQFAKLEARV